MSESNEVAFGIQIKGSIFRENEQPLDPDDFLSLFVDFIEDQGLLFSGITYPLNEEGEVVAPHSSTVELAQMAKDTQGVLDELIQRREEEIVRVELAELIEALEEIIEGPVLSQAVESPEGTQVSFYRGELAEHSYHGDYLTSMEAGDLMFILYLSNDYVVESFVVAVNEEHPDLPEFLEALAGHHLSLPKS